VGGDGQRLDRRPGTEQRRQPFLAFLGLKRAHGVDQHAAGSDQGDGVGQQAGLNHHQPGHVVRSLEQRDVGMAADGAGGAARGIEQHRVGRFLRDPARDIGGDGFGAQAKPGQIGVKSGEATGGAVHRHHPGAGRGQLGGLAARGRRQIEDPPAGKRTQQGCGQRRRGILNPPGAFAETGQLRDGPARGAAQRAAGGQDPGVQPLRPPAGFGGQLQRKVERRLAQMGLGDGAGALGAIGGLPRLPQPVGGVQAGGILPGQHRRPVAAQPAHHRVDQRFVGCRDRRGRGQRDRGIHGGMTGRAKTERLGGTQPQQVLDLGPQRTGPVEHGGNHRVKLAEPAQRRRRQQPDEGAIASLQSRGIESGFERLVERPPPAQDLRQHGQRQDPRPVRQRHLTPRARKKPGFPKAPGLWWVQGKALVGGKGRSPRNHPKLIGTP